MTIPPTDADLRARVQLRALVDEYARRTDAYDYEGWADLFTEDGTFSGVDPGEAEASSGVRGRAALVDVVRANDQFERTFHAVHNHLCEIDGDRATGVTYCSAHHLVAGGDGRPESLVMLIRYHDAYVVVDGAWRFADRRAEITWVEHHHADVSAYPFERGTVA